MNCSYSKKLTRVLLSAMSAFLFCADFVDAADKEIPETPRLVSAAEAKAMFDPFEFQYTGGIGPDITMPYRLYSPSKIVEGKKYPLLLWLHGWGDSGDNNWRQLHHANIALRRHRKNLPAFILVPQITLDVSWYQVAGVISPDDRLTAVWSLVEKTIESYPVDEDKISLLGISSGGSGAWEMGMRHPDRFAAIAPISSGGGDHSRVEKLIETPVWAFHSSGDVSTPVSGVRQTVQSLQDAGGRVRLTEVGSFDHDSWTSAFIQHDLLAWLIDQRRGDWSGWPESKRPTSLRFQWLKEKVVSNAGPIVFFLLVPLACYREVKRRKKFSLGKSEQELVAEN